MKQGGGVTFYAVDLGNDVGLKLEIDGSSNAQATATDVVSHLVTVTAGDPRIIAPPTDAELTASARATASAVATAAPAKPTP